MSTSIATETTGLTTGTWNLDASHSEIGFSVRHAGISKVRGRFNAATAVLTIGETLEASSVTATIEANSFDSGDANRDGHVRGTDFFDAEQFPTLDFASTSISGDAEEFKLAGELTIRGISKPVVFDSEFNGVAVDPYNLTRAGFTATTVISRKEFGLTYNAPLAAGGVLIGDKVTLTLDVAFVKA
ncbi:YceI family protein [Arthrobacter sp. 35W]|uniref:YceI family protein n=1 Tax=Arthrobacter sp. 35W TaxID=1132441 RepID=UPI000424800A|nr:YceI family protein [Arthrobacter sp. 35W]